MIEKQLAEKSRGVVAPGLRAAFHTPTVRFAERVHGPAPVMADHLESLARTTSPLSEQGSFEDKVDYSPKTEKSEIDYATDKLEKHTSADASAGEGETAFIKGEPVITSGADVSKFLVDLRDDGDPAITFRSFVLGTVFAGLGAAVCQIYLFKPVQVSVSSVFLLLLIYSFGTAWAKFLPRGSLVEGTRLAWLGPVLDFVNPGEFRIKEHVVATLVASTAAGGSTAVQNFAVQRLYYDTNVKATTAILATFSTACFGYGLVGLLRPLTVYPSEMVYWFNLPSVSIFQAMHFDSGANRKRVKLFWSAFTGMFCYEVIPSYIFPLLNGINVVCLATQKTSSSAQNVITNLFGGTDGNEGLGFLSISFDWQYITSQFTSLPLIQQANSWIGYTLCYAIVMTIYYSNAWNSLSFPMLSTSIFSSNGSVYDQAAVFGSDGILNTTALNEVGLPALTGSNAWSQLTANLSIGGLIAHTVLFWSPYVVESFKQAKAKTQPDPHWQIMSRSYKEVPWYWYIGLLLLSFFAGLIVVLKGQTTLPWWSYLVALLLGAFITPFSTLLYARMGNGIATNQLMKMVAGAINPGRPVANLYFSMWSHDVVGTSIGFAGDLKVGQYLKIPPRAMFATQVWGTIVGAAVNYAVMISIVDAQRDILLDPEGTNVWSGQYPQALNSAAITWSLAKQLYGPNGPYIWVPLSLLFGMVPTFFQWLISKRWPHIGPIRTDSIILPIIYMYSAWMTSGTNSPITSSIITGLVSQLWLRRYHPGWYRKYNYILGGALDGGAQVMIFILSFAVFGASGTPRPFPAWAGNPATGNTDYCNGNQE
ncbi:OPT superfamily oligopeptide transporter [Daedalea quercina L-15889]|uniref:OPT superfamily oligopeptide transporter n=1 Tax=Daedalea quercina L-15889 TaxID=1314783 RepID=A0A165SGN5_9APHY|nr:OPT superfamily oligopeptide transporter [Daedalea quercina L-15889]